MFGSHRGTLPHSVKYHRKQGNQIKHYDETMMRDRGKYLILTARTEANH